MRDEKLIQKLKEDVKHTYFESWGIPRTLESNLKTAIVRLEALLEDNERQKETVRSLELFEDALQSVNEALIAENKRLKAAYKWVRTSERFPEEHSNVVALDTDGIAATAYYDGKWHGILNCDAVTHWMQLPDLPKD